MLDKYTPKRGRRHPHQVLVGTAVGQLAVTAINSAPSFGDTKDRGDLLGQQRVYGMPTWWVIDQGGGVASAGAPAVHSGVRDLPQRTRPPVRQPHRYGVINGFQDGVFDLGGDPRRHHPD